MTPSPKVQFRAPTPRDVAAASFKPESVDHYVTTGELTFGQMAIDPEIQRPVDARLVNKIAAEFDPDALGVVVVSVRVDEDDKTHYVVLDGQQRLNGANKAGWKEPVMAKLHHGLTRQDEARLFRLLNNRKPVTPYQVFKAELVEGREVPVQIIEILREVGVPFGPPKGFGGVEAAKRIMALPNGTGAVSFRWALQVIKDVYAVDGFSSNIYDYRVVEALARLHHRHANRIKTQELVERLQARGSNVLSLIQAGKLQQDVNGGPLGPSIINAIIRIYNRKRQADGPTALPEWERVKADRSKTSAKVRRATAAASTNEANEQ